MMYTNGRAPALTRRTFGTLIAGALAGAAQTPASEPPTNFVLLVCDDLGYGDPGCYGNRSIRTPNIDRAAAEGARLTEFYAMSTCTPSRASLLTGRYPIRSGMTRVLLPGEHYGIPDSEITIAEALKERDYRTALIGKWHLGSRPPYRPNRHGYDYFYGLHHSHDMTLPMIHWPAIRLFRNEQVIESPAIHATLTRRFTQEATHFIEQNRNNPFFLHLPYTAPHLPWGASAEFTGKSKYGAYGDMVEEIDWSVGEILNALSRHGIDKRTAVFFLSDNGPELAAPGPGGSAGILRGGKGSTWEGGVRVPCVIRWPARVPAGNALAGITCTMDLYATILEAAGATVPLEYVVDGRSLWLYLAGESGPPRSTFFYYHGKLLVAVRADEWKLHLHKMPIRKRTVNADPVPCHPPELYNLKSDPGETRMVTKEHPEVAARLSGLGEDFRNSFIPGRTAPPRWRSVLPRIGGGKKKRP
jgi:arylsulfatase A